jgi:serine phosphatase RsbU (regulator of sigma subunit)
MLVIFAFSNVLTTVLTAALAVAIVNVVIRRESAYLIEEKLDAMVVNQRFQTELMMRGSPDCGTPASEPASVEVLDLVWPGSATSFTAITETTGSQNRPRWIHAPFTGLVVDGGHLSIRSVIRRKDSKCQVTMLAVTNLDEAEIDLMAQSTGLKMWDRGPINLHRYRALESIGSEISANFIPGSKRAVPVVITAQNWQSGKPEDWVICTVQLSYSRTAADLTRMGLRRASWLAPMGILSLSIIAVYVGGLLVSARLSRQIVAMVNGLSHAARKVGKGDFSVRVEVAGRDQLSLLASSFNDMTRDLHVLRQQEQQAALLAWDVTLAREVQEHLFPEAAESFPGISVSGLNHPARIVSGDLHGIFRFNDSEVGLLCADLSGKGVSAALMMAHLQGLIHGRLILPNESDARPSPAEFVEALNQDLLGRFGEGRYATLFYGEYDSRTQIMRFVNAGHCRPIVVCSSAEPRIISSGNVPIGLLPDAAFQETVVTLTPGSSMVVYTDGVTDALNSDGEPFGERKLLQCCDDGHREGDASVITRCILDSVVEWSSGVDRFDDVTLLAISVC